MYIWYTNLYIWYANLYIWYTNIEPDSITEGLNKGYGRRTKRNQSRCKRETTKEKETRKV